MKAGDINKLALLSTLQRLFGAENVEKEHRFHTVRRWRFDYAVPAAMIAVEYQGHAGFVGKKGASGHSSVIGLTNDCEKFNQARAAGWTVLCFTALHFNYAKRIAHNLTDPESIIMDTIARIQTERENAGTTATHSQQTSFL